MRMRYADPVSDFDNRDNYLAEKLERRPECIFCREHIQDEKAYNIPKIGYACVHCMESFEEFMED